MVRVNVPNMHTQFTGLSHLKQRHVLRREGHSGVQELAG